MEQMKPAQRDAQLLRKLADHIEQGQTPPAELRAAVLEIPALAAPAADANDHQRAMVLDAHTQTSALEAQLSQLAAVPASSSTGMGIVERVLKKMGAPVAESPLQPGRLERSDPRGRPLTTKQMTMLRRAIHVLVAQDVYPAGRRWGALTESVRNIASSTKTTERTVWRNAEALQLVARRMLDAADDHRIAKLRARAAIKFRR